MDPAGSPLGLTRLPKRQRKKLAEELQRSGVNGSLPVSLTHKRILDERWAAYKAGQVERITLSELKRRLVHR